MSADPLDVLLRLHDGDDRCGCLRKVVRLVDVGERAEAVDALESCLQAHPAGSLYRANTC